MPNEKKPIPMTDAHFRGMVWLYRLTNFIWNPRRHLKKVPLKKGVVVVDYGCGPGRYTNLVARRVGPKGKVIAVDIQPVAIRMVKEKATRAGLTNIEAILVDSYDTEIDEASADMVLLIDTFHMISDFDALLIDTFHMISDFDALLGEVHRILKQDGRLFMDPGHMKFSRAKEILDESGLFTIVKSVGRDMLLAPKENSPSKEAASS